MANSKKNLVVAYLLLIFLGEFGAHRFYLTGKYQGAALAQLILGVIGWMTVWVLIGFLPLTVVYTWNVIDLFLLPGIAKDGQEALKEAKAQEVFLSRQAQSE